MNIYLLRYNPYSNRQVKGYASLTQYQPYIEAFQQNVNFNPGDGVDTTIILNCGADQFDYAIIAEENVILSRWFVLDATRTRLGQYEYHLRRDAVYDHLEEVVNSTFYVEKGYVGLNNPAIYNQEQLTTNQIKQTEILLKDKTKTPWIVGYLGANEGASVSWDNYYSSVAVTQAQFETLSDTTKIFFDKIQEIRAISLPTSAYRRLPTEGVSFYAGLRFTPLGSLPTETITGGFAPPGSWKPTIIPTTNLIKEADALRLGDYLASTLEETTLAQELADNYSTLPQFSTFAHFDVISYNGKYYQVRFTRRSYDSSDSLTLGNESLTRQAIYTELQTAPYVNTRPSQVSDVPVKVYYTFSTYKCELEEIVDNYSATIPSSESIPKLNNQPYSMFCMPYLDFKAKRDSAVGFGNLQGQASMAIAQAISAQFSGTGALYDLQLLPYCPVLDAIDVYIDEYSGEEIPYLHIDKLVGGDSALTQINHTVGQTTTAVGYIIWGTKDTFTFDIDYSVPVPEDPIEFKVLNQAQLQRLCSPNYSGAFDFTATKSRGISKINVDCSYKPYAPYIHLNPDFGGLYGQDFNDARGLVCGGDFSLPQITDQWKTYQLNNKNYDNSFNREIESIELQNKYSRYSDIASAVGGTLQGARSGAVAGSFAGPVGMGVGAAVGGLASAAGGAVDVSINQRLREDQLDLKKDLYNLNLQNIQARPTTLSKIGSLNANNKLWPFIEVYDCTDTEKQMIRDKIQYNGMTINQIGPLYQFTQPGYFVKGQLIRTDLHEDYHLINTIKDELETGVFIE